MFTVIKMLMLFISIFFKIIMDKFKFEPLSRNIQKLNFHHSNLLLLYIFLTV